MKRPDVKTVVKDQRRNITYVIWAYRTVTQDEAQKAVADIHKQLADDGKEPRFGNTYEILTAYH
jgi:hypothetical protein